MCRDLINLGVTSNKSQDLKPINIDTSLLPHFIRGYFDGDGSVYLLNYKSRNRPLIKAGFNFVGTLDFLKFINQSMPIQSTIKKDKRTKFTYSLSFDSIKRYFLIRDYLYLNSNVYLNRKKEKIDLINLKLKKGSETSS